MDKELLIQFVQRHVPASQAVAEHIAEQFTKRTFVKNELLLRIDQISDDYVFLTEGFMRSFTFDPDGEEVTTYFFSPNQAVFEVSSLFLRQPSAEGIQAVTDCKAHVITFDKLNRLFHSVPEFREFGRAMLVREFAAFKQRALSLINQSAEERYADLMRQNPALFQRAQLKHIASFLGVTDSSLSRIRREFARQGH